MINVLLFPSGSLVAHEIFQSLRYEKKIELFGLDSLSSNWSSYTLSSSNFSSSIVTYSENTKQQFISELKGWIKNWNITCIYPCFDKFIRILKELESELETIVIAPSVKVCSIAESKRKTYNILRNIIKVPCEYSYENNIKYPIFIKPDYGYGSRNSFACYNQTELDSIKFKYNDLESFVICEYLPGKEYTVDCFTNYKNELIYVNVRERCKTLQGISIHTKCIIDKQIKSECNEMAKSIQKTIDMKGGWFFQVKYSSNKELCLLEIAPRIPGAMCLSRNLGINFPMLTLQTYLDLTNKNVNIISSNEELEVYKIFKNVFYPLLKYSTVYIDLDDTIIMNNVKNIKYVNLEVIKFLYQCVNNRVNIILLTRNKNPLELLLNYSISPKLFLEIVIVSNDEKKSKYIKNLDSIFIDDSFKERLDVYNTKEILVFGIDQIERLIES